MDLPPNRTTRLRGYTFAAVTVAAIILAGGYAVVFRPPAPGLIYWAGITGVCGAIVELALIVAMIRVERRTTDPSADMKALMPTLVFPATPLLVVFTYWPPELGLFVTVVGVGAAIAIAGKVVSVAAAVR